MNLRSLLLHDGRGSPRQDIRSGRKLPPAVRQREPQLAHGEFVESQTAGSGLPNLKPLASRVEHHASRITHLVSRVPHHASRITRPASRISYHASRITHHVSRITHHVSRVPHHASRITHHASRITYHASRITRLCMTFTASFSTESAFAPPRGIARLRIVEPSLEFAGH